MTAFDSVLSDVFDHSAEKRLSLDEERAAIEAAQGGDEAATIALVYAYAPALRNAVTKHPTVSQEDARSSAISGLIVAIHAFDPDSGDRLAGILRQYLDDTLAEEESHAHAFAVPTRSLKRFFGILRAAEDDVDRALEICHEYAMKPETFLSIRAAVAEAHGLQATSDDEADVIERARPLWSGDYSDAEDRILVETAFRAVAPLEERVCRIAYGFEDYDAQPDAVVAERVGLSRQKAQRTRTAALGTMRQALGVA